MRIKTDTAALRESIKGIRVEIDTRSRRICEMLNYYRDPVRGFRLYGKKPPQDMTNIENTCLALRREIIKLKVIKAELNLIVQLKEMSHA